MCQYHKTTDVIQNYSRVDYMCEAEMWFSVLIT